MTEKIRSGYRVSGYDTSTRSLHLWNFTDRDLANAFAKSLAESSSQEVHVLKYLGSWRKAKPPLEFIPAEGEEDGSTHTD